jgi:hypothetical protein
MVVCKSLRGGVARFDITGDGVTREHFEIER